MFFFPIQLGMSSSQLTFTASFFRGVGEKPPTSHVFDEPSIYPSILSARRSAVTNLNPLWSSSSKQKNFDPGIQSSRQWWTGDGVGSFAAFFKHWLQIRWVPVIKYPQTKLVRFYHQNCGFYEFYGIYIYVYIYILVGGLEHVFFSVGNNIIPTDEVHHFSEG